MEGVSEDIVPGHFMLQLPINKVVNIDKNVVNAKLKELQHDLKVRLGRPEELAIRNQLGLMSFRIRDYENALDHFQKVLSIDPENLNALSNLKYVMEKLFRMADAQFYKDKLQGLLQLGNAQPSEDLQQRQRCLKARCLAEQGYTHACDIHIDRVGEIRYVQANGLYHKAFDIAGDLIESLERDNWKFCVAKNAHKIVDFLTYKEEYNDAVDYLKEAEKLFFEVTQSTPGDPEFQWESWRHLADLIRGTIVKKDFKSYAFCPELEEYVNDPEKCMLEAKEIAPENAKLWARYANFVHSLKQKNGTKRAMEMLEKSIELDSSENNFYAFSTRARINLKNYKYWLAESEKNTSKRPPGPKQLEEAKKDFKKALAMTVSPWDLSYLGEVYHLLAKHPLYKEKGDEVVRKCLEDALLYFTKAADCEEGANQLFVHLTRGRCLSDMGEYQAAIGCFKQAILCEPEVCQYSGYFNELLQVYLCLLQKEPEPLKDGPLMAEMAYELKKARGKYGQSTLQKHSISKMKPKYKSEIQMLADYCMRFPEHKELVPLLTSDTKKPPFSCPVPTGGTLEQPWKAQFQPHGARSQPHLETIPVESRHAIPSAPSSQRSTAAAKQPRHCGSITGPSYVHVLMQEEQDHTGLEEAASTEEKSGDDGQGKNDTQDVGSLAAQLDGLHTSEVHADEEIRKAPESARVSGFKYDFYVVYPDCIKDWVIHTLLRELEYMWQLKGCARHRDALPGTFKFTEEINQMKESASILLVLGKNFVNCEQAMHHALRLKRDRGCERVIIPVVVNEEEPMPEELERFNPFDAVRNVKWSKLANCIEQQIKPVSF